MNRRRRLIRASAAASTLTAGALVLSACGGDSTADDRKVDVAASFYPMEFLAKEIGGEHVSVTQLTEPGADPHNLELSPKQVGQLSDADLVVYLRGLQPAVDQAVEQADVQRVAEVSSYTTLETHGGDDHGEHEHGGDSHGEHDHGGDHGEESAEGHDGGGDEGHDHSAEGGKDPHVWLDPTRYAEIAKGVGKQLAKADPKHKKTYQRNTKTLVTKLKALDADFRAGLDGRESDTIITTHAAFGYLTERYGLHEESIAGVDPESGSASGAHLKELHQIAKEDKVSTIFSASNSSDRSARTLADDLGLKTDNLNPLESVRDPEKQDYFSVMRANLTALRSALGAG
ncbi:ABC transporter substrate-binding protein [Streptomyces oceani]|uniref:ABC transporter substrate-binding protein n=2 Tax=Streptomyces oceani TaxID=1075402 RepID=A0A1E7KFN2_9ACTN|nr:ABC transporter substrate-binding protein [Streptomyces oceani]